MVKRFDLVLARAGGECSNRSVVAPHFSQTAATPRFGKKAVLRRSSSHTLAGSGKWHSLSRLTQ